MTGTYKLGKDIERICLYQKRLNTIDLLTQVIKSRLRYLFQIKRAVMKIFVPWGDSEQSGYDKQVFASFYQFECSS